LLLLSLIQEAPRHGYDLMTQIETRTGGAYKPSPGVIYPALEVLQDLGHVEISASETKKCYHITSDRQATLLEKSDSLTKISERFASPTETDQTTKTCGQRSTAYTIQSNPK
jgi:DNA-binding PadR family transcriptional regulator